MNPSINPSASLLKHFENLEDPRTDYLIKHKLLDIIGITICAVICVAETWVEITAIPQLLKVLEVEGCIVTIDAMGTQKEIEERPRVAVRRKGMLSDVSTNYRTRRGLYSQS
jgi:predicted transposase YbfD/YdcC